MPIPDRHRLNPANGAFQLPSQATSDCCTDRHRQACISLNGLLWLTQWPPHFFFNFVTLFPSPLAAALLPVVDRCCSCNSCCKAIKALWWGPWLIMPILYLAHHCGGGGSEAERLEVHKVGNDQITCCDLMTALWFGSSINLRSLVVGIGNGLKLHWSAIIY